jgi:NDP-sugar pyrophosphorylase family protein
MRAKPAISVAGEPIIRRIVRNLVAAGIKEITLNLHHLPHTITSILGDGSDLGARVRYSWEQPVVLGTAGGPRQALDILGTEAFLIVNGDTLTSIPIDRIWESHSQSGAMVTLGLIPNVKPQQYGGVHLSADGAVTGFVGPGPAAEGSFHFVGVQAVSVEAFAAVKRGSVARSIGGVYDRLVAERPGSVRGLVSQADFWDVGTIGDYWRTSMAFAADGRPIVGTNVDVAASARVTRSILWDDIVVGDRALLDRCIVTDGVRVPDQAVHTSAVLMRDAEGRLTSMPFSAD